MTNHTCPKCHIELLPDEIECSMCHLDELVDRVNTETRKIKAIDLQDVAYKILLSDALSQGR